MNLVLVHGFLGSAMNWSPILSRFERQTSIPGLQVRAFDLLGHAGRAFSGRPETITIEDVARDLADQIPFDVFVALGHSFGLRPVLKLSKLFPGRVQAIIAEDSSPEMRQESFEEIEPIFSSTPAPFATREEAKAFFERSWGPASAMGRFLLSNIRETSPGVHDWRFSAVAMRRLLQEASSHPLWSEWSSFPGPIEMVLGETSKFVSPEILKRCRENRKGLRLGVHQIAQAGHWVHADQPQAFFDCLIKVLKSLE